MGGAMWYVSQLTEAQRKTMRAMVDLDNLERVAGCGALARETTPSHPTIPFSDH
jgi:hypothetical protein